jgi:hypothetical protein
MEHETQADEGVSRRKFLKFGGLLGLALGALSLPSLGWGQTADAPSDVTEEDTRLAHKRRTRRSKRTRAKGRKRAAHGTRKGRKQTA